jgi:methionyl-tRNA synthetase
MSKSLGNTVQPLDYVTLYGADAFRFFVLREMVTGQDSNFSHDLFLVRYNGDLADSLGNLVSRLLHMIRRYASGRIPAGTIEEDPEKRVKNRAVQTLGAVREGYEKFSFSSALECLFSFVTELNTYLEVRAPWKLAKMGDELSRERLYGSLRTVAEGLRLVGELLRPIMPQVSEKILTYIGATPLKTWADLRWDETCMVHKNIGEWEILFPKIETEEENYAMS